MTRLEKDLISIAKDLGLTGKGEVWPLRIRRLYPGKHQRADGAWSWILVDSKGFEIIGSCDSASSVVKASRNGSLFINKTEYGSKELYVVK